MKDSYIIDANVPRFGSGEAKGIINESVRGKDLYLMVDVCNYNITYSLSGHENRMSPDDHYQNLKRVIAAIGGKGRRINVIMPFLYGFRGAAYGVMDELSHYYGAATHKLITNYRSTEAVLNLANEVLVSDEALKATRGKGKEVTFYAAHNQKKEAEYIAEQIRLLHNSESKQ